LRAWPLRRYWGKEVEEEFLVQLRDFALGAREHQFVRMRHERAVIAPG
jgi:hypothetical protein